MDAALLSVLTPLSGVEPGLKLMCLLDCRKRETLTKQARAEFLLENRSRTARPIYRARETPAILRRWELCVQRLTFRHNIIRLSIVRFTEAQAQRFAKRSFAPFSHRARGTRAAAVVLVTSAFMPRKEGTGVYRT